MNQTGWINLMKLSGEASDKCTYNGRPHCDMKMIEKYNEGLICTTACLGSYLDQCIVRDDMEEAHAHLQELKDIFGDRLFIEVQPFNDVEQIKANLVLIELAKSICTVFHLAFRLFLKKSYSNICVIQFALMDG